MPGRIFVASALAPFEVGKVPLTECLCVCGVVAVERELWGCECSSRRSSLDCNYVRATSGRGGVKANAERGGGGSPE